jgi:predicted dehydrogenase
LNLLRIGLYGTHGHQIHHVLTQPHAYPAALTAVAAFPAGTVEALRVSSGAFAVAEDLTSLLRRPDVDLVVLCSPRRGDQAADAIACLRAGKHVYAEKPAALTEADLDAILAAAQASGRRFHEMGGSAFEQPWFALRETVRSGVIGTVVQVVAQKSYPWHDGRPEDEFLDGGLIRQCAIHAVRFIEHVAGVRVAEVDAMETTCGNPSGGGGLRLAAVLMARLENGGLASITANYLNPLGFGSWGNEMLRVFGTDGMVEATDGGRRTRLVVGKDDCGPLDVSARPPDWLGGVMADCLGVGPMPLSLEEELHPLRVVIRANAAAKRRRLLQNPSGVFAREKSEYRRQESE